jgi:hypothetical protein
VRSRNSTRGRQKEATKSREIVGLPSLAFRQVHVVREDLRISSASLPQQSFWWANGGKILWDSRGNCNTNSTMGRKSLLQGTVASAQDA